LGTLCPSRFSNIYLFLEAVKSYSLWIRITTVVIMSMIWQGCVTKI